MNIIVKFLAYLVSMPARAKGVKFGTNSFIAPGYDFFSVQMKNIKFGKNVLMGRNAWLQTIESGFINIGDGCNLGRNVTISSLKGVTIGKKCLFSFNVSVLDHDHEIGNCNISPMDSGLSEPREVFIGDDCFIGAHSFILKGVHLGRHCVVGANSVVTKSFPDFCVLAGNPAKIIKKLHSAHG